MKRRNLLRDRVQVEDQHITGQHGIMKQRRARRTRPSTPFSLSL
jgi:hypothetical protein